MKFHWVFPIVSACLLVFATNARADHGPGTCAAGCSAEPAGILEPGHARLGLSWSHSRFERIKAAAIETRTREGGGHSHFDTVVSTLLQTWSLELGLTENAQLGISTGNYRGDDMRTGRIHMGSYTLHRYGDVSGATDTWLDLKLRASRSPREITMLFGLKLPTGRDDIVGETDAMPMDRLPLEASMQPGSGAFDGRLGFASSWRPSGRLVLDGSVTYTARGSDDDFKIGDQVDAGIKASWAAAGEPDDGPRTTWQAGIFVRHLLPGEEDGEEVHNSGGTVVFLSPGVNVAFNERVSWSLSPQWPLLQSLDGEQQETEFRVLMSLSFTF